AKTPACRNQQTTHQQPTTQTHTHPSKPRNRQRSGRRRTADNKATPTAGNAAHTAKTTARNHPPDLRTTPRPADGSTGYPTLSARTIAAFPPAEYETASGSGSRLRGNNGKPQSPNRGHPTSGRPHTPPAQQRETQYLAPNRQDADHQPHRHNRGTHRTNDNEEPHSSPKTRGTPHKRQRTQTGKNGHRETKHPVHPRGHETTLDPDRPPRRTAMQRHSAKPDTQPHMTPHRHQHNKAHKNTPATATRCA
ncbi:hypothetical protein GSD1FS_1979, partial [Bifidobacterium sp. GSD1FS]|nr:hypothetical protein [Bifidobacterium canis]